MNHHRSRYHTVMTFVFILFVIDGSHTAGHISGPFGFVRIARDLGRKFCAAEDESLREANVRGIRDI